MINEWEEFCAYTGTVSYTASKKSDTTWLGRFTFATILEFEGMARILTILARGYLFHSKDGASLNFSNSSPGTWNATVLLSVFIMCSSLF